jgi:ABC-type glycerol-3-phosphate transport system permease component
MPLALPVVATASIITFLLNWAQWLPVLVVSKSPDTYTLPVGLLSLNGELGVNFQGIMAMSVLTTIPVTLFFLAAQRRVIAGMTTGAVKG